ncbi:cysteine desulfurase-like protein [Conchiformibius kuhniae]|uniref:Cysteine desulfurase-like protein n=1 Tax=Conchiformibius kuhniae TaxID=211502 RepID=A0A8T9MWD5_9NEIS|nr:cysteine desulfurase-like protein [Conchiformibius kuhniae]
MDYPIDAVRRRFPALHHADGKGQLPVLFDGPGGSQVPQSVLDAMVGYLGRYNSNFGGFADAGVRTGRLVSDARQAAADWLGCAADEVFFGLNATSLMFNVSRAVAQTWRAGDNIVLSSLDHFSHVSSWQRAAEERGVAVRMLPLNADGSDLDYSALPDLLDGNTRLLAFAAASNVSGTVADTARLVAAARSVGAWVSVDAVHAAVHGLPDAAAWDCDFLFASAYKLGGPHLGICFGKRAHLHALRPYKVAPASEAVPNRWEQGTQSFEAQAGFIAMIDYWAALAEDGAGDRRSRLRRSYAQVRRYEQGISRAVLDGFRQRPFVRLYGLDSEHGRTPTFAFNIVRPNGGIVCPQQIAAWFGERNVAVGSGNFYAWDVVSHLGVAETGLLRIGCMHYTTHDEIACFFALLDEWVQTHL